MLNNLLKIPQLIAEWNEPIETCVHFYKSKLNPSLITTEEAYLYLPSIPREIKPQWQSQEHSLGMLES